METFKVKRIKQGCCYITEGKVYEAKWEFKDHYVFVMMDNGEWSSSHWFPGFFEVVA